MVESGPRTKRQRKKKKIFPPFVAQNLFKLLRCPPTQLQLHVVSKNLKKA